MDVLIVFEIKLIVILFSLTTGSHPEGRTIRGLHHHHRPPFRCHEPTREEQFRPHRRSFAHGESPARRRHQRKNHRREFVC